MIAWTQEQSINFECAREVINDLMAIHSTQIYAEENQPEPNQNKIAQFGAELIRLKRERAALSVNDDEAVAQVRSKYNPIVRSMREENREEWSKLV